MEGNFQIDSDDAIRAGEGPSPSRRDRAKNRTAASIGPIQWAGASDARDARLAGADDLSAAPAPR